MKPKLYESLMQKDAGFKEVMEKLKLKADHPFLKRYSALGVKEGYFSDMAGALGRMHDTMVDAAWSEMIGRSIINVMPTNEAMERFPIDAGALTNTLKALLPGSQAKKPQLLTSTQTFWQTLQTSGPENTSKTLHGMSWTVQHRTSVTL